MRISPISAYEPVAYVYKPNSISSNSLSKVKPIGEDLLASRTDFSGMTQDQNQETINPLRRGETANFADVYMMQTQMGRMNAERIMKPAQPGAEEAVKSEEGRKVEPADQGAQSNDATYQMRRAIDAYQMFMTA